MLTYSLKVTMSLLQNRTFRNEILGVLTKLYMNLTTPDYINVCQCYIFLDDAESVAEVLEKLLKGDEVSAAKGDTLKFLNFRTPKTFAVIYQKFKQRGPNLRVCIFRVATRQGKVREIEIFSRSGNCQVIL